MNDMIERVARAIWTAAKDNAAASWEGHIPEARAAIEAMESSQDAEIERLRARLALADAAIDQALRQALGQKP